MITTPTLIKKGALTSMTKAVILDADTVTSGDVSLSPITSLVDARIYGHTDYADIAERIADAEIVLTNKCRITAEVFEKCPNIKFIGLFATGYNNIDTVCAEKHGCVVANVPGYSTNSVAQHTFALILNYYSNIAQYDISVKRGDWQGSKLFTYFNMPFFELNGKAIGIIGYGAIGKAVKKIASAFGMKVLVYTRTVPADCEGIEVVGLNELLSRSDIVTLHCPLNDGTKELINSSTLKLMKPSAVLINTSRGGVICEKDLADALNNNVISYAGLDVLTTEPMSKDCPLIGAKNCCFTPHIAWAPLETRVRLINMVAENISAYLSGNPINNVAALN